MGKGKVAVIGGGASGMCASIFARRAGCNVTLFDLNPNFGRKLVKTGSGRCNFANEDDKIKHYHSSSNEHVKSALSKFSKDDIISFMEEIGVSAKSIDGWYYPNSLQAKSVRDCLLMEMEIHGITLMPDCKINGIARDGERFILDSQKGVLAFDGVILATGGMAAPESGSDGNGYVLAQNLGHEIITPLPALSPLVCDEAILKKASGIRIDAGVTLIIAGKKHTETGNLQITDYGISGICTMQLSYLASKALHEKQKVGCELDFLPEIKDKALSKILNERFIKRGRGKNVFASLIGLLPDKIIGIILEKSNIRPQVPAVNISKDQMDEIIRQIKSYKLNITDTKGFSSSQTTYGGVSFADIDKNTLLSKKLNNLGFCGEILDVSGDCGGYNLMWAIRSAAIVGNSILGGK